MIRTYPLGASNIEKLCANKLPHLTCYFESFLCALAFAVRKNVFKHGWNMYVKYCYMIPPLSGLLGLPKHRWRPANKTPYLYSVFTTYCSFQTKCICDLKDMGIISMHEWKVPLNYWGTRLTQSGPLGYCKEWWSCRHHDLWARYLVTKGGDK